MKLFGLIGYPLSHSFSKKYFTAKFEREGLANCRYELFPLTSIRELPDLLQSHPDLLGLNITIPYKKQVLEYLDLRGNIPEALNACNCIRVKEGKLDGYNTDWTGFKNSLSPLLETQHRHALILGNGGATAAVVFALQQLGIGSTIVSRNLHNGSALTYQQLDEKIIRENTIIINTTPLGMYPHTDACPDIPYSFIGEQHLLYDLLYNPGKTLFLQKGEERGAMIKNGEEMLVMQAEESWKIWSV